MTAPVKSRNSAANAAKPAARRGSIPVFSLYGEVAGAHDVEFVHIEEIRTRSERYDWAIGSHVHKGLVQALFLFKGSAQVVLDNRVEEVGLPCAVIVPPGTIHSFRFEKEATHGFVLTVAAALPLQSGDSRAQSLFEHLFAEPTLVDLRACAPRVEALLGEILAESRSTSPAHALMCEWLAASTLLLVARERAQVQASGIDDRRAALFRRFRKLVEEHYAEHWPVGRYALTLHVTESRLDRICRALAGRSAFEIVQDRLMLEARRRLVHLAVPVSALAYELGFEDPAYFCRAFKRCTGHTPSDFRRQQRADMGLEATA